MPNSSRWLTVVSALSVACCTLQAQSPSQPTDAKPAAAKDSSNKDFSKEAYVIEQNSSRVTFENDGTSASESTAKIRIQSDAGVQHWGILSFPYENSTQIVEIDYVRVRKPDNTLITTSAEGIQDMPSEVSRQAPLYSDLKEKHLAVKGLSAGDVLEFQSHTRTTKPLAPGQFWFAFSFPHDGIRLHEQLEIRVPRERPIKWKSSGSQPDTTEDGAHRVFTWRRSQLEHPSSEQDKKEEEETLRQALRGKLPPPDIELSSFQSWGEVGRWYGGLQLERIKPTPEIRAKAAELTKNAPDEAARIRAIYSYVSTQFRYIGIDFGIGRYQPHSAADVLGNQYGDCKDKHTLLASMLDAAGVKAYPALISTRHEIDPEVPSPGQFDHVISVVPQGASLLWLDTTPEVAPFSYLVSPLRGKQALVISEEKAPSLILTPEDSPLKALQTFHTKAKLSDAGTLQGTIERTTQGDDYEILFRGAFRRVPLTNWQALVQQLSLAAGFAGDVSEVTADTPEKTEEPFHFAYTYTRKDYPDWSERRISAPLPPIALPEIGEDDKTPPHSIWLGSPEEIHSTSEVELPKGYSAQLPKPVDLDLSFAEYHSSSSFKDGVLTTDRRIIFKRRELLVSDYDSYKKFSKRVTDDRDVYVSLYTGAKPPTKASSYQEDIWKLPYSTNHEAAGLYDEARNDFTRNDVAAEISSLRRAVELDPKFARAWLWLGEIYKYKQDFDSAVTSYRKGIEADPQQPVGYKVLGLAFSGKAQFDEALPVLRQLVQLAPEDAEAQSLLGSTLLKLKRNPEAVTALEAAAKLSPLEAGIQTALGGAYLSFGDDAKALTAYQAALAQDPSQPMYNDVAYAMATAGKLLPTALEYARKAVAEEEEASLKLKLSELTVDDLPHTVRLAAFWDTLGWVYFQQGNFAQAEKFLNASWMLSQHAEVADHLRRVYEKQHKTQAAARMQRFVVPAAPGSAAAAAKLNPQAASLNFNNPDLVNLRITKLDRFTKGTSSTEMFLLLAWDPAASEFKVADWKAIPGSDKLHPSPQVMNSIHFKLSSPDSAPAHVVRRGILGCYEYTGCSIVLFEPDRVRSVN